MKLDPILLVGAGDHARACIDVIEQEGRFTVAGLIGQAHELGSMVLGYPVRGTDDDLGAFARECQRALVVVGQIKTPEPRIRLFQLLEQQGCALPVVVSPHGYVSRHATIGAGSIVMHGAIINAGARVGRNCIINSHALVEHDVVIGDHCHISTAAAINGGVRIGDGTFVGSGSAIRQGLVLGDRCLIGMGQRVLADCEPGTRLPPARPSS